MTQEDKIGLGVMQIAAAQPTNICTFKRAYTDMPTYVKLTPGNLKGSVTRPGEPMWHQIVRNIKSHQGGPHFNFIDAGYLVHVPRTGYRITNKGLNHLKSKGLI